MNSNFRITRAQEMLIGLVALSLGGVLVLPTLLVIPMSFSSADLLEFPPAHWSVRWWRELSQSVVWVDAIRLSISLAIGTTLIAVPSAFAAAFATVSATKRRANVIHAALVSPLLVPPILIASGLFFIYSRFSLNGTFSGLLIGHVLMALPVAYLILRPAILGFDFEQERAARSLGASRWEATWEIMIPQIAPSVVIAILLAFLTSLDEVIISIFVGSGRATTITKVMFESLRDRIDPIAAVVSTGWTTVVFVVVAVVVLRSGSTEGQVRVASDS